MNTAQILAALMVVGSAVAINFIVAGLSKILQNAAWWRRLLPVAPGILGAIVAPGVWPRVLRLSSSGYEALDAVPWGNFWSLTLLLGVAHGAIAANLYKVVMQTILGRDGALERMIAKKTEKPDA